MRNILLLSTLAFGLLFHDGQGMQESKEIVPFGFNYTNNPIPDTLSQGETYPFCFPNTLQQTITEGHHDYLLLSDEESLKNMDSHKKMSFSGFIQGESFRSEIGDPIHYYIVANPNNPPKNVLFCVYGGGSANSPLNEITQDLASYGTIVVTLNLVDIGERLIGNLGNQNFYSSHLLLRVMDSIQVARYKVPQIIQQNLSNLDFGQHLEGMKYFVMGSSFGGTLTELIATNPEFHSLFDGFISYAGSSDVILDMQSKTLGAFERSLDMRGYKPFFDFEHLNAFNQAVNLSRPILLLHGLEDTNVHPMNSVCFAARLADLGKINLVNLKILPNFEHAFPQKPDDLFFLTASISQFMENPVQKSGPVWDALGYLGLERSYEQASKTFALGDLDTLNNVSNQFFAKSLESFRCFFKMIGGNKVTYIRSLKQDGMWNFEWDTTYSPLLKEIFLDNFVIGDFQQFYVTAFKEFNIHKNGPDAPPEIIVGLFSPIYKWFLEVTQNQNTLSDFYSTHYDINHSCCNSQILSKLRKINDIFGGQVDLLDGISQRQSQDLTHTCASRMLIDIFEQQNISFPRDYGQLAFLDWEVNLLSKLMPNEVEISEQNEVLYILHLTFQQQYFEALQGIQNIIKGKSYFQKKILKVEEELQPVLRLKIQSSLKTLLAPLKARIEEMRGTQMRIEYK